MREFDRHTGIKRRELLTRMAAAGLTMGLFSGCGGGSGGAASGGGGGPVPAIEPGNVVGRVELSQIGGQGLQVVSLFQDPSSVSESGDFSTAASPSGAQLLFLTDASGQVRALTVSVPAADGTLAALTFSAETTALAWIMMTPGIVTTDPARAAETVAMIRSLPGFQAVVGYLAARLATQSVSELRTDPQLDQLMTSVILDLAARTGLDIPGEESVSARETEFESVQRTGVAVKRQTPNPGSPNTPFLLENRAWRFVNIIRQEVLPTGQEHRHLAPELLQTPQVEKNLVPGVNNLSIANAALGQFNVPGSALDLVNLNAPVLGNVTYWVKGPGAGIGALLGQGDTLPPSIPELEFGQAAFGVSLLFYALMPVVDFASAGLSALGVPKLIDLCLQAWDLLLSKGITLDNLIKAMRSGDPDGTKVAIFEFWQAVVTLGLGGIAALFAGSTVGTAALFAGILLAGIGLVMSGFNVLICIKHWFQHEHIAKIEVPVLEPPGLFPLGDGLVLHGINDQGTVLYSSQAEGLVLKRFGALPIQLSSRPSVAAALNNLDDCVYKDAASGDVLFRSSSGGLLTILPPPSSADKSQFLPRYLNDEPVAVGTFQSGDGRVDAWVNARTKVEDNETESTSLNLTARLHPALKALSLVGFNNNRLLIGTADVTLSQRTQQGETFIPGFILDPLPVEEVTFSEGLHFNFRLDLNGGQPDPGAVAVRFDRLNPGNSTPPPPLYRELNNKDHILISEGTGARIQPVGVVNGAQTVFAFNDDDEVAGGDGNGQLRLFSAGSSRGLDSLVPLGFTNPGGLTWVGQLMRGKFAIVQDASGRFYVLARV